MRDADLDALLDKQACTELVYKVARGVDRCDEALLRSAFHENATDDHGMFSGTATDFVTWVLPVLNTMARTQHCICNVLIEVNGDHAVGESYFIAHHTLPQPPKDDVFMIAAGRYLDRFERREGVWRIAHRQATYDWSAQTSSTDSWDRTPSSPMNFGKRGPQDASYANVANRESAAQ